MNHSTLKYLVASLFVFSLLSLTMMCNVDAQNMLVLQGEQHWDTYGIGGTCDHGPNDLSIADIDGDSINEIIVGGFTYNIINGSRTPLQAPLTVWNWNGQNFTLKSSCKWPGTIEVVYAADIDGNDAKEIITSGLFKNDSGTFSSLRVWHSSNGTLSLVSHYEGITVSSIFVSTLNNKGMLGIFATGSFDADSQHKAQLFLWHLEGNTLVLDNSWKLDAANVTSSNSVYASNLTDGQIEIFTAGYTGNLNNSAGQLCVWYLNGTTLSLKADKEWQMQSGGYAPNIAGGILGNTVVNNLKVGDLDANGVPEIVTGGFTYDGSKAEGELRIWSWNGSALNLLSKREWINDDITEVLSVSTGNVDNDTSVEIVTGGMLAPYGSFNTNATSPDRGQLGIWSWDGKKLTLKEIEDWTLAEGVSVWNVGTTDLNNDGKVEIVSCGCISFNKLCDPDMRVWSVMQSSTQGGFSNLPFLLLATILAILVSIVILALTTRRMNKANKISSKSM